MIVAVELEDPEPALRGFGKLLLRQVDRSVPRDSPRFR